MDRSLYPEGVEVHQRHLANTESTKATALKNVLLDAISGGVASGLAVTINTPNTTRIDVAVGTGYAVNGEPLALSIAQLNVSLADYTLNALNYVLLMYDEVASWPESHKTDGTTRNTRAVVTPRLTVLTAAQYAALPATDAILTNNSADRALLLAIVTANGAGVPLSTGSVQGPTVFNSILQSSQPVAITGLSIISVDVATPIGIGTIAFTTSGSLLKWKSPGDTYGANVAALATGNYTLVSTSGRSIVVAVQFAQLPTSDKTDNISIANLYGQTVTRLTSEDVQHRSFIGSGIPTAKNPHGLTVLDLDPTSGSSTEAHQDEMHSNGIWSDSASNLLAAAVATSGADKITFIDFATGDLAFVNGRNVQALSVAPQMTFTDGVLEAALYGIYLLSDGTITKLVRAQYPTTSLLKPILQIVDVSDNITNGTKSITWTTSGLISFDGGPTVPSPTLATTVVRLYSVDRVSWVDCNVKISSNPGVNSTDVITFISPPPTEENLLLVHAFWNGSSSQFLGYGFGTENAPNALVDKRVFGTLGKKDLSTSIGQISAKDQLDDLVDSGVYVRATKNQFAVNGSTTLASAAADQFVLGSVSALAATITGGTVYVAGKRYDIPTTVLALTASVDNRIYISNSGALTVTPTSSWSTVEATERQQSYARLYTLTLNGGGTETARVDYRRYVSLHKDQPFGVVGLNSNTQAAITSTTGQALTVTSPDSSAIVGTSQLTAGHGVVGVCTGATGSGTMGQGYFALDSLITVTNGYGIIVRTGPGIGTATAGLDITPNTGHTFDRGINVLAGPGAITWGIVVAGATTGLQISSAVTGATIAATGLGLDVSTSGATSISTNKRITVGTGTSTFGGNITVGAGTSTFVNGATFGNNITVGAGTSTFTGAISGSSASMTGNLSAGGIVITTGTGTSTFGGAITTGTTNRSTFGGPITTTTNATSIFGGPITTTTTGISNFGGSIAVPSGTSSFGAINVNGDTTSNFLYVDNAGNPANAGFYTDGQTTRTDYNFGFHAYYTSSPSGLMSGVEGFLYLKEDNVFGTNYRRLYFYNTGGEHFITG